MMYNQQKSFDSDYGHARYSRSGSGIAYSNHQPLSLGAMAVRVLRQLALVIERLFVVGKYQFYKKTAVAPSAMKVPVAKVAILCAFAFFVFRKDASLEMGMGARQRADMGGMPVAETVAYEEPPTSKKSAWGGLTAIFESKDYFADEAGDDAETKRVKSYIRRFKDLAIEESERYNIPASVKMAQGILETNAGASQLAKKNNNHFGVKCFSRTCSKGHCSNFGDDSHKDFFRKYGNSWESWRAHSKMIVSGKYKTLLKYGDDYEKWAKGLKKLGYATAKHYDNTLIELIEKYHLDELDK